MRPETVPSPPDVSFIVAAFDAEATLPRAIASALASTGVTVEVVVADDASRDGTAALVEGIAAREPRVRLVRLATNGGPGAARNAALAAARGRLVAVLDADDAVHPDRMARLTRLMEETGAEAAVDNLEHVGGEAGDTPRRMFPPQLFERMGTLTLGSYVLANRLFAGGYNFGYLKPVFRRAALLRRDLRYPETIRIGEDFLFLAALLARGGRCATCGAVGYTYHVRQGSLSRVLRIAHVERMVETDREFLREHALDAQGARAWAARAKSLEEALAFLAAVEAVKRRRPVAALAQALRAPRAMRHFRMPVALRLRRLRARLPLFHRFAAGVSR